MLFTVLALLTILAGLLSALFWWRSATLEYSYDFGGFEESNIQLCFDNFSVNVISIIKHTKLCLFMYRRIIDDYNNNKTLNNYSKISAMLNSMAAFYAATAMLFAAIKEIASLCI